MNHERKQVDKAGHKNSQRKVASLKETAWLCRNFSSYSADIAKNIDPQDESFVYEPPQDIKVGTRT